MSHGWGIAEEASQQRRAKHVADLKHPEPGDRFEHWKGGIYEVKGTAYDSRDGKALTLYQDPLDQFRRVWARPTGEFKQEIETGAGWVPRFKFLPAPLPSPDKGG